MSKTLDAVQDDIVPPQLVVKAMRDSGYKNTAYALAELIDNSIQAGASSVELLCAEDEEFVHERRRRRVRQIAVLDNGSGMDEGTLRKALQFGNGTHLNDRSGIGRFGMGLPNASISQCEHVEVWTWQAGRPSAMYSHLDLTAIGRGEMRFIPAPLPKAVPNMWAKVGKTWGNSGTLVVWSRLDRLMWRSAKAIIENSEFLIGRIYRRFIHDGTLSIRLAAFLENDLGKLSEDSLAVPNDPIYLMAPSSTPSPFESNPMFEPWGQPQTLQVGWAGGKFPVTVRYSMAKKEARESSASGVPAGNLPHGKHANKNMGVSLMRAGRELDLLTNGFVAGYNPVERWWGVEVEFDPQLDELFGVTNNKQSARNFSDVAALDQTALMAEGENDVQLKLRLLEENDPRGPLLELIETIRKNVRTILRAIDQQQVATRGTRRRYNPNSPEMRGTARTLVRKDEGHVGSSDDDENLPLDERAKTLTRYFEDRGFSPAQAEEQAVQILNYGLKYTFTSADLETPAFFSVESKAGVLTITLNMRHPAYGSLLEVLFQENLDGVKEEELKSRLVAAGSGLKLVLEAWARYEDELTGPRRDRVQEARVQWGMVARQFLSEEGS